MIWIENVRPLKETRKWRIIHVKSLELALGIKELLSEFEAVVDINTKGEYILDSEGRYMIHQIRATDTDFGKWIDDLGLIEIGSYRSRRNYVLKGEES